MVRVGKVGGPVQEDRGEEERWERLLEVGPGEGRREGRGQKIALAKLGGGELWTVSARGDRCLGPSPSGYVGLGEHKETPSDPSKLWPRSGSCPDSLHLVPGWGPQGLGKAAPALLIASPQTHSHTTVPRQGASPANQARGQHSCQTPVTRGTELAKEG